MNNLLKVLTRSNPTVALGSQNKFYLYLYLYFNNSPEKEIGRGLPYCMMTNKDLLSKFIFVKLHKLLYFYAWIYLYSKSHHCSLKHLIPPTVLFLQNVTTTDRTNHCAVAIAAETSNQIWMPKDHC